VVLQTFEPEHYVIRAAAGHNFRAFYQQELDYRRRLGYPPFARLVRLEFRHTDSGRAETTAQNLAAQIKTWLAAEDRRATEMIGPAPCFFARVGGEHRWQIILRGPDPASLLRRRALAEWRIEVDPASLL
jgi:primosomal protein N' (replication factor Y)